MGMGTSSFTAGLSGLGGSIGRGINNLSQQLWDKPLLTDGHPGDFMAGPELDPSTPVPQQGILNDIGDRISQRWDAGGGLEGFGERLREAAASGDFSVSPYETPGARVGGLDGEYSNLTEDDEEEAMRGLGDGSEDYPGARGRPPGLDGETGEQPGITGTLQQAYSRSQVGPGGDNMTNRARQQGLGGLVDEESMGSSPEDIRRRARRSYT